MAPDTPKNVAIPVGPLETNCYIVFDVQKKLGLIVDPGAEAGRIIRQIGSLGIIPLGIILTHGHMDHIGAVQEIKEHFAVPVMIHKADSTMLHSPLNMELAAAFNVPPAPAPDRLLAEGDDIECGDAVLKVIHTPGHTPGSIVLQTGNLLFTGDTLFQGSVGRTDLPGGDGGCMQLSLQKLMRLPAESVILPGHGDSSTLADEIATNPFL